MKDHKKWVWQNAKFCESVSWTVGVQERAKSEDSRMPQVTDFCTWWDWYLICSIFVRQLLDFKIVYSIKYLLKYEAGICTNFFYIIPNITLNIPTILSVSKSWGFILLQCLGIKSKMSLSLDNLFSKHFWILLCANFSTC